MKKNLRTCIEVPYLSEPVTLVDMNNYEMIQQSGMTPDLKHKKSAHMTAAWSFAQKTCIRLPIATEFTAHRFLTFSVFAVNGQGGSFQLRLETKASDDLVSGYVRTLPISRNGWNDYRVDVPFLEALNEPDGLDQITAIALDCAIGGQANRTDTVLYIDNVFGWENAAPSCYAALPELKGAALFSKTASYAIVDRERLPVAPDADPEARPFEQNGTLWLPMAPVAAVLARRAVADNKAFSLSFIYRRRSYVFYGNSDRYLENGEEAVLPFRPTVRAGSLFFPADYLREFFHWRQIFTDPTGLVVLSNRKNAFESDRDAALLWELNAAVTFSIPTGSEILADLHRKISNPDKGRLLLLPEEWMAQRKLAKSDADLKTLLDTFKKDYGTASSAFSAQPVYADGAYREELLSLASDRCVAFSALFRMTGDKKYAERAAQECEALGQAFPEEGTDAMQFSQFALGMSLAYDWCHSAWTEARKAILERSILRRVLRPAVEYYNGKRQMRELGSSDAAVIDCGLTAAALALADVYPETAQRILAHSVRHISACMEAYAPDGGFGESVPAWERATRAIVLTVAFLESACGKDYGLSASSGFSATARFAVAAETANGTWGYNGASSALANTATFGWFSKKFDNQMPAWIRLRDLLSESKPVDALDLVWYTPIDRSKVPELPLDALYRKAGLVMLRSGWGKSDAFLGLHGGSNHEGRVELDAGSFRLEMGGEIFFADPEGALPTALERRAEGHNTLTVGNVSSRLFDQNPDAVVPLTEARSAPERAYAVADLSSVSDLILRGKRGILLTQGRTVAVVQDELTLTEPTAIVWRAYTAASVKHASSRTLLLEQNGVTLLCKLSGAGGARFEVNDVEGTPYRAVTIRADGVEKLRLAVACKLFAEGDDRSEKLYELAPMSTWEI